MVTTVPSYDVRQLNEATWPAFADLVERHNGVWGGAGAWGSTPRRRPAPVTTACRRRRWSVAARPTTRLAFDGERCVGWCQFGSPDELPRIKFGKAYLAGADEPPDWRITCFFVDSAIPQAWCGGRRAEGSVARDRSPRRRDGREHARRTWKAGRCRTRSSTTRRLDVRARGLRPRPSAGQEQLARQQAGAEGPTGRWRSCLTDAVSAAAVTVCCSDGGRPALG